MNELRELTRRVERVEAELAVLRPAVGRPPAGPPVDATRATRTVSVAAAQAPGSGADVDGRRMPRRDADEEALVFGTWFARIGALALLLGAAFGFKYAVDRGWIGPAARVAIGIAVGLALVAAGERARSRAWPRLAQALAGGGTGLLYLSLWAAFALYGLIPAWVAFGALALTAGAAVALALRHDSDVLAVLALGGGFLNPYLTGFDRLQAALLAYVLVLDVAVLGLGYFRKWRSVEAAALAGTWVVAIATLLDSPEAPVPAFATAYFGVYLGRALVHAIVRSRATEEADLALLGANAAAYLAVAALALDRDLLGAFTAALGTLHVAVSLMVRSRAASDRLLRLWLLATGVVFLTIAVPIELDGASLALVWAIEGVGLLAVGRATGLQRSTIGGLVVLAMSVLSSVAADHELGGDYEPARLLFSVDGLTFAIQITAVFAVSWTLSRAPRVGWGRRASEVTAAAGHALVLTWFTFEAMAAFGHPTEFGRPRAFAELQFTETTIWALYAIALLSIGVAARSRVTRMTAAGLFAVVLLKLCAFDLWLLEPLHRTVAFIGLGALLLVGSFMYHRFRDLLVEGSVDERGRP